MSEENTIEEATDVTDLDGPKQLREALKRAQEERDEYRAHLLNDSFKEIGLDPATGLGKAIAKEYKGAPTKEALAAFAAEEYGHQAAAAPENPVAPAVQAGQAVTQLIDSISTPEIPATRDTRIAEAERAGDLTTAGAEKAARLAEMFARQSGR